MDLEITDYQGTRWETWRNKDLVNTFSPLQLLNLVEGKTINHRGVAYRQVFTSCTQ